MANQEYIEKIVTLYRNQKITGKFVDLIPLTENDLSDVVRLRNHPKMMYSFNQNYQLTLDMQKSWFVKYLGRTNDLYWKICSKDGGFLGTNRIYDITPEIADQGSIMVDPDNSMNGPVAAEGMLLSLVFAFDIIGVSRIINDDREENKKMNSLSKHFGFEYLYDIDIRGVKFRHYELEKDNFRRENVQKIIDLWVSR